MNYEDDNLDALEDPENVAMLLHEALEAEASEEEPADDSHDQTLQPPAKRSRPSEPLLGSEHNPDSELDSPLSLPTAPPGLVPTSKPKAAILNESKLNFDHGLSYLALETLADITSYADTSPDQVAERAAGQDILITKEMPVPGEVIKQLPDSVRLICEAGTGFNNIDTEAAKARGITVCNVPSYSTQAVAHLVMTCVMNFSCSMVQQQLKVARGDNLRWRSIGSLPHFELQGKTLGLIGGRGSIGSAVADLALALGMKVLISSRSPEPSPKQSEGVEVADMHALLQRSDFVSIHCPLNPQTRHSIGSAELKQMKPTAYLINTARGPIVNELELVAALKDGSIAGAALDVHEVEPLPVDSPLFSLDNVILTPHIGWQRLETRQRLMDTVAENCSAFLAGSPVNSVTS